MDNVHTDDPDDEGDGQPIRVGRMITLYKLGEGGMGIVYAAYDPELDRKVALKMIHPTRSGRPDGQARLLREAQALARLAHPNVVGIHDVGTHGRRVWLAIEFVQGKTMDVWLAERPRGWREVLAVFEQVARGIAAAHRAGLLHRDLKPANIMLGDDGRVRVMDFGLVRSDSAEQAGTLDRPDVLDIDLTLTGAVLGTPAYMAPEQLLGLPADARTDQFSFCVALWEALYGARPFPEVTWGTRRSAALSGKRNRPTKAAHVPGWVGRIVERGLSPRPEQRFSDMTELLAALRADPTRRRWIVGAGLGLALGVGVWFGAGHLQQRAALRACDAAGAAIDDVWNQAARGRLQAGLTNTGVSYAAMTAEKITPWLDDYTEQWRRARVEVCQAATVEHTLDAETAAQANGCLDERRRHVELFIGVGANPGDDAKARKFVEDVVSEAAKLPLLSVCTDPAHLRALAALPADPDERAERQRLENLLIEATVFTIGGDSEEAFARADVVQNGAEEHGWLPLVAGARLIRARQLARANQLQAAERELEQAFYASGAASDDETAAEAARRLGTLLGRQDRRGEEALHWNRLAQMSLDRAGVGASDVRRSQILAAAARFHSSKGEHPAALELQEQALDISERGYGPTHPDTAAILQNLAVTHSKLGDHARAQALNERAVEIFGSTLGTDHPKTTDAMSTLAISYADRGVYPAAVELFERVLATRERTGADDKNLTMALANLGDAYRLAGDIEAAERMLARACALSARSQGSEHSETLRCMTRLAGVYEQRGELDQAAELYSQALSALEKIHGVDHPEVASTLTNIGVISRKLGEFDRASAALQRAMQIQEKALAPAHPDLAATVYSLALVHAQQHQHKTALQLLARARAIWEAKDSPNPTRIATVLGSIGTVLLRSGELEQATTTLEQAVARFEATVGPEHRSIAPVLSALGEAWTERGRPELGRPALERALVIRQGRGEDPFDLADTQFALARALWSDESQRPRARELARQAHDVYSTGSERAVRHRERLPHVRQWLALHRG